MFGFAGIFRYQSKDANQNWLCVALCTYRAIEPALFCLEIHVSNHSTARRLRSHRDSFRSDTKRFYSDHPTASPTERPTTHPTDGTQLDVVVDDDRDTNGSGNAGDGEAEDTFDVGSDVGSRVGSEVGSDVGLAVGFEVGSVDMFFDLRLTELSPSKRNPMRNKKELNYANSK